MRQTNTANDGGMNRRQVLSAIGGSAVATSLAGCSTLLEGGDSANQEGQSGDGISDEPIEAGLLTFTRGAPGVLGIQAQRGAELAVQRINDAGGIGGQREMRLDVVDEGSNALDSYNQFIEEGKDVTFGPISSGTHSQIAPEVEQNEVVNVGTDGTVTTLYEETVTDPTYSFRFQNYDVMEVVTMAREAVERLGADNIDTVAGVNPGYSFGEDEQRVFRQAIQQLTDAEVVYEGFPELGASDMSNHITSINDAEPDVTFSSLWGGDVTTFVRQAAANNMFENTTVFGTTLYSAAGDVPGDALEGADIFSGSRNYYWGQPALGNWAPGQELFDAATQQDGVVVPTAHYMSGYGAVAAWATAVEKAITLLGTYPSQEQIAQMLEGHGFFTPAGYHNMAEDHQGASNSFAGQMVYDDDLGAARLDDVNTYSATETSPPPGVTASDWLSSWSA
jgi:branched-chain amino acid transport system substrate-binding protein